MKKSARDLAIDEMAERAAYALLDEDCPDPSFFPGREASGEMRLAVAVLESAMEEHDIAWLHSYGFKRRPMSFGMVAAILGREDLDGLRLECMALEAKGYRRRDEPRGEHAMRITIERDHHRHVKKVAA